MVLSEVSKTRWGSSVSLGYQAACRSVTEAELVKKRSATGIVLWENKANKNQRTWWGNNAALLNLKFTHLQLIWMRPPSNSDLLPQRCGSSSIVAPRWPMRATWYCVGLTRTWHTSNSGGLMHSRVCGQFGHYLHIVNKITILDRHYLKTHLIFRSVCVAVSVQLSQVCGVKHTLNTVPYKKVAVQTKRKVLGYSFASALWF